MVDAVDSKTKTTSFQEVDKLHAHDVPSSPFGTLGDGTAADGESVFPTVVCFLVDAAVAIDVVFVVVLVVVFAFVVVRVEVFGLVVVFLEVEVRVVEGFF